MASTHRSGRSVLLAVLALGMGAAACGDDSASSAPPDRTTPASVVTVPATPPLDEMTSITACELLPQAEAEAIVGVALELIPASDDHRCSYTADPVDGRLVGAGLSIQPTPATVADLDGLRAVLAPETIEDIEGLGESALYHLDGALHDLQFVKNGVWVNITVVGIAGEGDDVLRAAEMQIAEAAAARL